MKHVLNKCQNTAKMVENWPHQSNHLGSFTSSNDVPMALNSFGSLPSG